MTETEAQCWSHTRKCSAGLIGLRRLIRAVPVAVEAAEAIVVGASTETATAASSVAIRISLASWVLKSALICDVLDFIMTWSMLAHLHCGSCLAHRRCKQLEAYRCRNRVYPAQRCDEAPRKVYEVVLEGLRKSGCVGDVKRKLKAESKSVRPTRSAVANHMPRLA